MSSIRISKEFTFEMAHALYKYEGKCANIHGHSYHLTVTIIGEPQVSENSADDGMVIDFSELKGIVEKKVLNDFDHALVLREGHTAINPLHREFKVVAVNYQPTCENLLLDIVKRIKPNIQQPARLHSLKLRETATCYAEWFATDNG